MNSLGELKKLNPREVWKNEAREFTPWLKNNIFKLSEALGIEIDLVQREVAVGDFAVDLMGKEVQTNKPVIIENQLEETDHSHLGQVIAYAAGLEAGIIVWISPSFRDEHRQALEWLNSISTKETSFFGVELELLQIDNSKPAPHFRIVAQPSEWGPIGPDVTDKQQAYFKFYELFLRELKKMSPSFTTATKSTYGNWYAIGAGKSGFSYCFTFCKDNRFRVELYLDLGDKEETKDVFDSLYGKREEIEKIFGMPLEWERLDHRRASRIAIYTDGSILDPEPKLAEIIVWAAKIGIQFKEVFAPYISIL